MAIAHELSSEIAAALFSAKERSPRELNDLKEVIFKIHSTLEELTHDAHVANYASRAIQIRDGLNENSVEEPATAISGVPLA